MVVSGTNFVLMRRVRPELLGSRRAASELALESSGGERFEEAALLVRLGDSGCGAEDSAVCGEESVSCAGRSRGGRPLPRLTTDGEAGDSDSDWFASDGLATAGEESLELRERMC